MSLINQIKTKIKTEHQGKIFYRNDPMSKVIKNGQATLVGNGLFVLEGDLARILDLIEKQVMIIAASVGAKPVHVPSILSWDNVVKSEYLKSFNNQALIVDPLAEHKEYEKHLGLASPTVCYHFFSALTGRSISKSKVITAYSKCCRKEEECLTDLGRLTNFSMREIIFLGTEKFCINTRQKILEATMKMMNEVFDLSYQVVTASDPFFGENSEAKKTAQILSESKYEVQTLIPFNNSAISTSSYNFHGKVFYDRFHICPGKPELSYSGCVGWGYERLLYSVLAQKGVNFSSKYYKKLLI